MAHGRSAISGLMEMREFLAHLGMRKTGGRRADLKIVALAKSPRQGAVTDHFSRRILACHGSSTHTYSGNPSSVSRRHRSWRGQLSGIGASEAISRILRCSWIERTGRENQVQLFVCRLGDVIRVGNEQTSADSPLRLLAFAICAEGSAGVASRRSPLTFPCHRLHGHAYEPVETSDCQINGDSRFDIQLVRKR